jgi:hypothetical protein
MIFFLNKNDMKYFPFSMTTNICTVPIRVSKNNREIDPTEDERQGIVQNITKQAYWHVSSCKPGMSLRN